MVSFQGALGSLESLATAQEASAYLEQAGLAESLVVQNCCRREKMVSIHTDELFDIESCEIKKY